MSVTRAGGMDANGATRIGDAEREQAVSAIGEHYAAGRLDHNELDERIEAAWKARTHADIAVLFTDLPGASPLQAVAAPVSPRRYRERLDTPTRRGGPPIRLLILILAFVVITGPFSAFWLIPLFWVFMARTAFRHSHRPRSAGSRA